MGGNVCSQEKQELEEQRLALVEEVQSYRGRIAQLEADLLFRLSNSQARLLPCLGACTTMLGFARDLLLRLSGVQAQPSSGGHAWLQYALGTIHDTSLESILPVMCAATTGACAPKRCACLCNHVP